LVTFFKVRFVNDIYVGNLSFCTKTIFGTAFEQVR